MDTDLWRLPDESKIFSKNLSKIDVELAFEKDCLLKSGFAQTIFRPYWKKNLLRDGEAALITIIRADTIMYSFLLTLRSTISDEANENRKDEKFPTRVTEQDRVLMPFVAAWVFKHCHDHLDGANNKDGSDQK